MMVAALKMTKSLSVTKSGLHAIEKLVFSLNGVYGCVLSE